MPFKRGKKYEDKLRRVLDANFNRAKEGLRVCEDTCRFFFDAPKASAGYKGVRHDLTEAMQGLQVLDLIGARAVAADVGKGSSRSELRRTDVRDIFYANSQRVKESVRVLEEFAKLIDRDAARRLKSLRYRIYELEQQVVARF